MIRQNGSALIISLLILLVMTMLGITSMSTSTLEEKMAANDRNQKVAFENAELALKDAETAVLDNDWMGGIKTNIVNNQAGYYDIDEKADYFSSTTWQPDECQTVSLNSSGNACYIVEYVSDEMPLEAGGGYSQLTDSNMAYKVLKVSTNSTGNNANGNATVQSTTRKAFIPNP